MTEYREDEQPRTREAPPTLTLMSVAKILTFWRPGSFDPPWTWADEYTQLITENGEGVTDKIKARVDAEGIDFLDHHSPVLLGSDRRVWDGHHRICIAIEREIHYLMVEVADPSE